MVDFGNAPKDRWVCPNDRQLALRAKLKTGWSVKTQQLHSYGRQDSSLNQSEQDIILQVIRRAEQLEQVEQERVGRLVERLENMKRNALGNGTNQCVLCGDSFGMLGAPSLLCRDCNKAVCQKCGIETFSAHKEPIALCKICSETREIWKKSGAWFFKGLPKYVLPQKKNVEPGKYGPRRLQRPGIEKNNWSRGVSTSRGEEEESSSEDELTRRSRHNQANGSAVRQASVTFDVKQPQGAGATSPGPATQRSDSLSLSLPSDQDVPDLPLASDGERPAAYFRESLESGGRTPSSSLQEPCSGETEMLDNTSPLHLQQQPQQQQYQQQHQQQQHPQQHLGHMRRDSQASSGSMREWGWSDDRLSVSSGQRTLSSLGDLTEEAVVVVDSAAVSPAHASRSILEQQAQLGTIELSLLYDPIAFALHCSLHRAKGLKPMDINGLSDPFCRLNLLPTGGKSNRLKTRTVHKTRNPEFNETLTFYGVTDTDLAKKIMHILVLDDDKYGHDFIGEARIVLSHLQPQQMRHMIVPLEKHYLVEEEDEVWGSDTWTRGQILVTLCYSTRRRALVVGVARCANLIPMDNNGYSDPFVKLRLKPDPYHRKYKTGIKWKNLNPVFNEEFVFDTKMTELPKQSLEITVWDKDYGKSNDYLGGLELGWHSKGERLKHWVDMIKFPDHRHEGWHNLCEDMLGD
ncbi:rabphilin-3A [Anabrus simplex]|uniref:rabphilin-3A n=1 Tax=Anabrus simplex TaxID=316456 RepID=UPI0035A366A6